MKLILPVCCFALASHASAQQKLYACTELLVLYEIENYDTTPQALLLPAAFNVFGSYYDIGVRPGTGTILAMEAGLMGQAGYEYDPETGVTVAYETCLYTTTNSQYVSSIDSDHDGTFYGHRYVPSSATTVSLMSTDANPYCFTRFGPSVPVNNVGDVAFDRDGTLISTRDGSTLLDRIDPLTGGVTSFGDPGIAFAGLEIDTDGSLYGLTTTGALYRVDRSTFLPTLVLQLPGAPYTGLAFREPAGRLDPTLICTAQPNSTGLPATLRAEQLAGPAPGSIEFQARRLPPLGFGMLLVASSTVTSPLGSGVLCLGSGIQRASSAILSNTVGSTNYTVDLTAVPGYGVVMSGDQLYFQAWFRDSTPAGQATSNLTAALLVEFLY